jgi:hypothetical protein
MVDPREQQQRVHEADAARREKEELRDQFLALRLVR